MCIEKIITCGGIYTYGCVPFLTCNPDTGACDARFIPGRPCDDFNPCTVNDNCAEELKCTGTLLAVGTTCQNANCTQAGTCLGDGRCNCIADRPNNGFLPSSIDNSPTQTPIITDSNPSQSSAATIVLGTGVLVLATTITIVALLNRNDDY